MQMDCRLIIDPPSSGAWNMAVDEALLLDASENESASLRFYRWNEPTLSLGYFQRYEDRDLHAASRECAVVRRQTGGGAILHDRELTYSLVLPPGHPLARQNERLYQIVHEVFVRSLWPPNNQPDEASHLHIRGEGIALPPADEPFLCFQRRAKGDVVFVPEKSGSTAVNLSQNPSPAAADWKIIGSAQRRHHGAVLQHGSLLIERSQSAPELQGLRDLAGRSAAEDAVISGVIGGLSIALALRMRPTKLPAELESIATRIANNKYGTPAWTKRR
jgi:lipoate-protein ligase A